MPSVKPTKTTPPFHTNNTEINNGGHQLHPGNGKTVEEMLNDMLQPIPKPVQLPSFVTLPETGTIIAREKLIN